MVTKQKVKNKFKQTDIGIVPSDWDVQRIGDVTIIQNGGTPQTNIPEYWNGGIKWCTPTDITKNNYKYLYNTERTITEKGLQNSSATLLPKGTLLLCSRATIGEVKISADKISTNQGFKSLIAKNNINNEFLYYKILTMKKLLIERAYGSTFLEVSKSAVANLKIPVPPLKEQQKIASALSDMDKLIESLEKIIDKKKKIKQGTMQQLLTGKKRLPGFTGDWLLKTIDSVAEVQRGETLTNSTLIPGNIPVIAGGKQPAYYHAYSNRKGKNITISASGANAGFVNFFNGPIFASDCSTVSSKSKEVCTKYLYYNLKLRQQEIYYLQTGGAQPHVHPSDIKPLLVNLPPFKEQQAIAEILSDMDAEIEHLEQKLEKYKELKEGMMQELLTGRIRLV